MSGISITVRGTQSIVSHLAKISKVKKREIMGTVGGFLVHAAHDRVKAGIVIDGSKIKPSQRAKAQGGQTLDDRGHMLGAYRITAVGETFVTVGFGSSWENRKAAYHQYGTSGPYPIKPIRALALAWKPYGAQYLSKRNKKAQSRKRIIRASVMHPGLPPRPVFGFGKGDKDKILAIVGKAISTAAGGTL